MIERSGEMSSKNQDLGHSVIKAFMNFKHAEIKSFQIPGYSKSETRFIFILSRGLKSRGPKFVFPILVTCLEFQNQASRK